MNLLLSLFKCCQMGDVSLPSEGYWNENVWKRGWVIEAGHFLRPPTSTWLYRELNQRATPAKMLGLTMLHFGVLVIGMWKHSAVSCFKHCHSYILFFFLLGTIPLRMLWVPWFHRARYTPAACSKIYNCVVYIVQSVSRWKCCLK